MSWLLKFFVTAIIGILALKALGGSDDPLLPVTTDDRNYHVAVRYVDQPSHRMVIVGSSLSVRLSEDYFTSPNIENLALAGGSPETGLQIIAANEPLPQLVLVEANILTRPVDARLIERLKARLTTATPAASAPGWITPLRPYRPNMRAGVVEVSSTHRSRVILPVTTPWYIRSMRCSTEPMPLGILRKSPSPSSFWSFMQNGQWSVETIWMSLVRRDCHMWC